MYKTRPQSYGLSTAIVLLGFGFCPVVSSAQLLGVQRLQQNLSSLHQNKRLVRASRLQSSCLLGSVGVSQLLYIVAGSVNTTGVVGLAQPTTGSSGGGVTGSSLAYPGVVGLGVLHLRTDKTGEPNGLLVCEGMQPSQQPGASLILCKDVQGFSSVSFAPIPMDLPEFRSVPAPSSLFLLLLSIHYY